MARIPIRTTLGLAALLLAAGPAAGQRAYTANTLTATEGMTSPAARLEDASWLEGAWAGEGLDGWNEKLWTAPGGGSMMGAFRHMKEDAVVFYEFLTLVESDGTLELRIKHFHPDMLGWEEKDGMVRFPLVRMDESTLWFDGLTMRRDGPDRMTSVVALRSREGQVSEASFTYRRVGPAAH